MTNMTPLLLQINCPRCNKIKSLKNIYNPSNPKRCADLDNILCYEPLGWVVVNSINKLIIKGAK